MVNNPPTVASPASASPSSVTGTTTNLSVLGADDGGEANLTYTWSASPPGGVSFSANGTNAAKNATATFSGPGSYTFTATIRDGGGLTVTSSVAATVSQTVTSIAVSPASATVTFGGTQQFTASATDQFGASMTPAFTWSVSGGGTIDASGLFSAGSTAGTFTVTAASGGVPGTASVTVANSAPTVASPASASPNPVSGATTNLSVLGADDGGEPGLTYTWSASGPAAVSFSANGTNGAKNTTAGFSQSGSYTLTATIRDAYGLTATSSLPVTVSQTLTSIAVSPASAAVRVGGTQQFTASAADQFGKPMSPAFTWTVSGGGTISGTGLFSAGNSAGGPFTVRASSGGVSGTASVTVTDFTVSATPPSRSVVAGSSALYTVTVTPLAGFSSTVTLSVSGLPVGATASFSPSATSSPATLTVTTAQGHSGTYTLTITGNGGGLVRTTTVSLSVSQH